MIEEKIISEKEDETTAAPIVETTDETKPERENENGDQSEVESENANEQEKENANENETENLRERADGFVHGSFDSKPPTDVSADALYPLKAHTKNLSAVAAVFGQSEEDIEREFKEYKAAKLFKKFESDATGVRGDDEIKSSAENCLKFGFGGLIVLPQYIVTAKKTISVNADIIAAVSYPYGEEIPYSTAKSAIKAAKRGATILLIPVGVSFIKRADLDSVRRTFKKIVKKSRAKVCAVLECGALSSEETERALKVLSDCGVKRFRSSTGFLTGQDEFMNLKSMRSAYKNGNYITATVNSSNSADAVRLLSLSDGVSSRHAVEIAREIREKLNLK